MIQEDGLLDMEVNEEGETMREEERGRPRDRPRNKWIKRKREGVERREEDWIGVTEGRR